MTDEPMVMRDSPKAARRVRVSGWRSRRGRFFGDDERTARYDGCTHVPCDGCGQPVVKSRIRCDACQAAIDRQKYDARERAPWDGVAMLYSEVRDRYYGSPEDAADALDDGETLDDLRLVICDPQYVPTLTEDYCHDEMAEDGELPSEVLDAMETFNAAVGGVILSWFPGKYALALESSGA